MDQQIKHRHSVSQPALKIGPDPMHHFLEMANQRQHRQHRFDDHAGVPFAPPAKAEVLRLPICFGKAFVTEQDHALGIALGQVLEGTAVVDVGGVDVPIHDQPEMIEDVGQLAANDPAPVREPFLADLLLTATFAARMEQLDALRVDQADQGRLSHKALGPVSMGNEQPKQTRATGQLREQHLIVALEPAIDGPIANAFERKQNGNRDHFAGIQAGLSVFLRLGHPIIHAAKQVDDKIFGSHDYTLLGSRRLLEKCIS